MFTLDVANRTVHVPHAKHKRNFILLKIIYSESLYDIGLNLILSPAAFLSFTFNHHSFQLTPPTPMYIVTSIILIQHYYPNNAKTDHKEVAVLNNFPYTINSNERRPQLSDSINQSFHPIQCLIRNSNPIYQTWNNTENTHLNNV